MTRPAFYRHSTRSLRSGFTLMEMLIVLTIIALLMGIAMFSMTGYVGQAKEERTAADIANFKEDLIAYQLASGTLPTTEQGIKALWSKPTVEPIPQHWRAFVDGETLDPWGHPYVYRNPGKHNPDSYDVFSMGPDGLPDTADDIGNWKDTTSTNP